MSLPRQERFLGGATTTQDSGPLSIAGGNRPLCRAPGCQGAAGQVLVFGLTEAKPFFPSTVRHRALAAGGSERASGSRGAGIGADRASQGPPNVSERADRLRRQPEGRPDNDGSRDDQPDLRPVRPPHAGRLEEAADAANAYLSRLGWGGLSSSSGSVPKTGLTAGRHAPEGNAGGRAVQRAGWPGPTRPHKDAESWFRFG